MTGDTELTSDKPDIIGSCASYCPAYLIKYQQLAVWMGSHCLTITSSQISCRLADLLHDCLHTT